VVSEKPFAFWIIRYKDLEVQLGRKGFSISDEPSVSGDRCHRNLHGVDRQDAKQFQKDHLKNPDIYWCTNKGCLEHTEDRDDILQEILP
jgi:hypothetical protein